MDYKVLRRQSTWIVDYTRRNITHKVTKSIIKPLLSALYDTFVVTVSESCDNTFLIWELG